jgi:Arc/MetJ-type ribon-helix-helix transcriptional regulator
MDRITVSLPEERVNEIEARVQDDDTYDSKSHYVRECITEYESLLQRVEDLEQEVDRLENEKRTLISDREERTDLVEYVERQRDLEREEREKRNAPAWRRAKYWLFGYNSEATGSDR